MSIPASVLEEIRARAKESWPDDKDMKEYSVKEEIGGYRQFQSIDFSGVLDEQKVQIIESAKDIYEGWDEIASEVEGEIEALKELKKFEPPNIASELLNQWKKEADDENEGYFRLQLKEIQRKARQHKSIRNTRKEIDPIKQLLIELEDIVGNECYNGYIQNYSSWGELESEGRSFRYPGNSLMEKKSIKSGMSQ
ncbi:MAG: hypothetical protein LPH21_17420 [Shewanella sp.]|nr:hypothetical protein [Shewanella sp.]